MTMANSGSKGLKVTFIPCVYLISELKNRTISYDIFQTSFLICYDFLHTVDLSGNFRVFKLSRISDFGTFHEV